MRKIACGLLALGFAACAAQEKTSAQPEVAQKVQSENAEAPGVDDKSSMSATNLVDEEGGKFAPIYFEYDSDALKPESTEELKKVAEYMNGHKVNVTVEGHCDERGTPEYNMALGDRRANAASKYLVRLGVNQQRVKTISYGEERPAVDGHDETAWAQNRRGEFAVQGKKNVSAKN